MSFWTRVGVVSVLATATFSGYDQVVASVPPSASLTGIDAMAVESLLEPTASDWEFADLASRETGVRPEFIAGQNGLVLLANEIARVFPNDYALAEVRDGRLRLGFRAGVPDGLRDDIRSLGIDVTLTEDLGTSERAINVTLIETYAKLMGFSEVQDASAGYRVEGQVLEFVVAADSNIAADDLVRRLAVPSPYRVDIRLVEAELGQDHTVNGGGRLEISGGSSLACTSGFGVSKGGQLGIVTAGHCSDSAMTYEDWTDQPEVAIGARDAQHIGAYGDMQIHLFTATSTDDIYYNASHALGDITGVLDPINGIVLCRYGLNSGQQCDEVYAQDHCKSVQGVAACGMTLMNVNEAGPGDSGGPWYASGKAYGMHQGEKNWWGAKDIFTPATNFIAAFGGVIRF